MWLIPYPALEIVIGWLAFVFPLPMISAIRYLVRRRRMFSNFRDFYKFNGMAIAMLMMFIGIEVLMFSAWVFLHVTARGFETYPFWVLNFMRETMNYVFAVAATVTVVGSICWGRIAIDSPLSRPGAWIAALLSFVFCVWMAIFSPV